MNFYAAFLAICMFLTSFSNFAEAQTLSETEIKPPFITISCTANDGNLGALGLVTKQLNITETTEQLTLNVKSELLVCASDSTRNFKWIEANPYAGFEVQYFDGRTNSINTRKVFIDPTKSYNRMGLVTLSNPDSAHGKSAAATMTSTGGNSFEGSVTINKADILNQKDLTKLNRGELVKKTISLYHISNLTTEIDGEELQLGDENRSGRNIFLHFKKMGTKIVLIADVNISN